MRGPLPKDPALRQRRNKPSTRAVLTMPTERKRAPSLPPRSDDQKWHALTLSWWRSVWHSPMASEYLEADVKGRLYRLAVLVDRFWVRPDIKLDAQICHNEAALGLSPMDRRRLQWTVEKAEQEQRKRHAPSSIDQDDPRKLLEVIK